jgi:bacterioferritin
MDMRKELIEGLNEDLSYELSAVHQYIYNASVISGMSRLLLRDFFIEEANEEKEHAIYLAEKIVSLGGEPVITAKPFEKNKDVKGMLKSSIQAEIETIERYKERLEMAEKANEIELKLKLEDMLADEIKHKEEMERLMSDFVF